MNSFLRMSLKTSMVLSAVLAFAGCSDSPRQYGNQTPAPAQRPGLPGDSDPNTIEKPTVPESDSGAEPVLTQDELVRREARAPIVYGVGAGGITWDTDFNIARTKLSKPAYGPDANGVSRYNSGMQILWRTNEPRRPLAIRMWTDYLGSFDVGGTFGRWELGQDLSRFFEDDETGKKFIVELYNHLEKKNPAYSCLKSEACQITSQDDQVVLKMPKLALGIAKDRKSLAKVLLTKLDPRGKLHNEFDLVAGEFLIPAAQGREKIALGQTWQEVLAINVENTGTDVGPSGMGKSYDGVYLTLTKSDFSRDYKSEPLMNERLKAVSLYGAYQSALRVNGKLIEMKPDPNGGLELELAGGEAIKDKKYVRLGVEIDRAAQVDFVRAFMEILKTEFSKSGGEVLTQLRGLHKPNGVKSYSGFVISYNSKTSKGRVVSLGFSEGLRTLTGIAVSDVISTSDKIIVPALAEPYNAGGSTFAGFKLKDRVVLKDIDLGRGEASVVLPGDGGVERASYADATTLEVSYDGANREFQTQTKVSFGTLGVGLGLVPVKGKAGEFEITSVSSQAAKVSKLCGIEGLEAAAGDEARDLLSRVQRAIAAEKAKNKDFTCQYFQINDRRDTGRMEHLFFADQKLKLSFAERELDLITVYAKPSEVQ